jgi:tripartite-type tricarboxylate transporter receptor subunit TctC
MIVQTLPIVQVTRKGSGRFDLAAFNWIGNMDDSANVFISTRASGIKTIEDARQSELIVGSTTPSAIGGILPEMSNRLLGTRFRIVNGYKSGEAIDLALQRGEVNGRAGASWSAMKALRGRQIEAGEINVFLQAGLRREPDLSGVPLMTDLASNEHDASILSFYSGMAALARAIATTPGAPADRIIMLRSAFEAAMSDPALLDEAEKSGLQVRPLSGDKLQEIIGTMVKISPELLLP